MTRECQDCAFTTDDDAEAEQHTRDTDHCVEESEEQDKPKEKR